MNNSSITAQLVFGCNPQRDMKHGHVKLLRNYRIKQQNDDAAGTLQNYYQA